MRVFGGSAGLRFTVFLCMAGAASPLFADRLVLRNLNVISDKTVTAFDEDGVRLSEGGSVSWDEIERGTVAPDKQAAFDQMLNELGTNLYRIRQRLAVEDYEGLLSHAEAVYPRYRQRRSATAYMVCQAVMWGRIAAHRREEAVEPYWRCFELLRVAKGKPVSLPGERRLQVDLDTGVTPELLPVWFDVDASKKVLDDVYQVMTQLSKPLPEAARIYFGTLALTAGDEERAASVLRGFTPTNPVIQQLRDAALAQREVQLGQAGGAVTNLENNLSTYSALSKPVALYWIGRAQVASGEERIRQEGMLQLLRIAAVFGDKFPELAAAGLYHTMRALSDGNASAPSAAVRKELMDRYGHTFHAALVKAKSSASSSK